MYCGTLRCTVRYTVDVLWFTKIYYGLLRSTVVYVVLWLSCIYDSLPGLFTGVWLT